MDTTQYNRIFQYLTTQQLPSDLNTQQLIKQFKNFCTPFIIKNNYLYRKDKQKGVGTAKEAVTVRKNTEEKKCQFHKQNYM